MLSTVSNVLDLRRIGMDVLKSSIWVVRGRTCSTRRRVDGDSRELFTEMVRWKHKTYVRIEYTCDFSEAVNQDLPMQITEYLRSHTLQHPKPRPSAMRQVHHIT